MVVSLFQSSLGVELSVLLQNVQFIRLAGGTTGAMNNRARKYGDLLVGMGDDIPDVIGLTETFVKMPTDTIATKLNNTHPYQLRVFPEMIPFGRFADSGLTLLSRFPVEAHDFRMFTDASGLDALAAKGVLVALIRLPASFAVVSLTHQNSDGTKAVYTSQLGTARDLVREFVSNNIPVSALNYTAVVSMGDYNIASNTETYREMITTLAHETKDSHDVLNLGEDGFTYPTHNAKERIDYVFNLKAIDKNQKCAFPSSTVTKYAVDNLVLNDSLSDHLGVSATFSIDEKSDGSLSTLMHKKDSCDPEYFDSLTSSLRSSLTSIKSCDVPLYCPNTLYCCQSQLLLIPLLFLACIVLLPILSNLCIWHHKT